jgi:hypothetical protein
LAIILATGLGFTVPCKEENNRISEVVKVLMPLRTLWNNIRLQQQQSVKSIKNIKKGF